jgi:hypothetical protein
MPVALYKGMLSPAENKIGRLARLFEVFAFARSCALKCL